MVRMAWIDLRLWLLAVAVSLALGTTGLAQTAGVGAAEEGAGEGSVRWRAGDHEGALQFWESKLEGAAELPSRERARLAYNVGVAHHTAGEPLRAAAWFESSLRLAPRWDDAKANRDLARADAGLDPKDMGLVGGFVRFFTRGEAEWLALLGGLLIFVAGAFDAFRGGGWGRGPWLAILLLPFFWTPLLGHIFQGESEAVMVIDEDGAALYGTPDTGGERLGKLNQGAESLVLDRLPGWVKVLDRGEERWTDEDSVLSLMR